MREKKRGERHEICVDCGGCYWNPIHKSKNVFELKNEWKRKQYSTDKWKTTKNCAFFVSIPLKISPVCSILHASFCCFKKKKKTKQKDQRNMIIITPIKKSLMLNETHWSSSRIPFGSGQRTNKPVKIITTDHHNSCSYFPSTHFRFKFIFLIRVYSLFFSTRRLKNKELFFFQLDRSQNCVHFFPMLLLHLSTYMSRNYVCVLFLSEKNRISDVMVLTKRMSYTRTHARTLQWCKWHAFALELFFRFIECQSINGNSMNKGNRWNQKPFENITQKNWEKKTKWIGSSQQKTINGKKIDMIRTDITTAKFCLSK